MSVPEDVSKSNSALAETIVSSFTSFLREDEDEDKCPINTNVVDSIKAALDARFSNIVRCFENLNADTDKLQSPDPINFSPSISHLGTRGISEVCRRLSSSCLGYQLNYVTALDNSKK